MLLPLDIPAGFYKTGTDLEGAGRWRDGSLVRWRDGSLRPVGGWRQRVNSNFTEVPRGALAWIDNSAVQRLAFGSANKLWAVSSAGAVTDITPASVATGLASAVVETGYGFGTYGSATYGTERPDTAAFSEATTWSLDNFGQLLVGCASSDGKLVSWDLNNSNNAATISNAPVDCKALLVTEERFLFALASGGNSRKISWCDKEALTTWSASATNEAGDIELQTTGRIQCGIRARGQSLILTTNDAHTASYTGPPYVYGFNRVGTNCGVISRKAAASVDAGVFWMGEKGFFKFNGSSVEPVKCDVADYVFDGINRAQKSKVWAVVNGGNKEIWWFYPSEGSNEIDRYVGYDYEEGHWLIGELSRTAGVEAGVFRNPIWTDGSDIYDHEIALDYDEANIFAETAPIALASGDQIMRVTQIVPDEATAGDVTVTLKTRLYPNAAETSHGPFTMANPTSVRLQGRQVRMRVDAARLADWRVGIMRLDATAGSRR